MILPVIPKKYTFTKNISIDSAMGKKNVAQRIPRRDVPVPTRISAVSYLLLFYSPEGQMELQQKMDLNKWGGMYTIYTYINLNIKKGSLIDVSKYTYILRISEYYLIVTCFHLAVAKKTTCPANSQNHHKHHQKNLQ